MGHERSIEPMRDARRTGLPPDGVRRADRRSVRRRRSRGRRLRRLGFGVVFVLLALVVAAVVVALVSGDDPGGGFAGTWKKSGPGTQLVIDEVGDRKFTISVAMIGSADGGADVSGTGSPGASASRLSKATLRGDVLTAKDMLGVKGLTVTFTLDDGGAVLVETFPNGSVDRLERVE